MKQQQKFTAHGTAVGYCSSLLLCLLALLLGNSVALAESVDATDTAILEKKPSQDPLRKLKARLAKQYPSVQHLSIKAYLEHYPEALLVDVRAPQEYAVSRIPGAIHIEDRSALLTFARERAERPIVLYCSVGARSAEAAAFLLENDAANVMNLAGSIFQWSNEGRPLENDAGSTTQVHPFNAWWGWRYLLDAKPPP